MKRRRNDAAHSLTLYVVFSILMIIIYTIVELVTATITGISHDTLTTCFYGVFGGEILCCASIKIFKLRSGCNDNTIDFRDQRYN